MPIFKKILFPIDFSETSNQIVPYVIEILDKFEAEVHIIFVTHVNQYYDWMGMQSPCVVDFEDEVKKQAKNQLQSFIDNHFTDYSIVSIIMVGYPGEEILRYAKDEKIDLIIMGHSKTGIKRMILGSVAGHVIKKSPVPVLVVNSNEITS